MLEFPPSPSRVCRRFPHSAWHSLLSWALHGELCSRQDFSPSAQWSHLPFPCSFYRQL